MVQRFNVILTLFIFIQTKEVTLIKIPIGKATTFVEIKLVGETSKYSYLVI